MGAIPDTLGLAGELASFASQPLAERESRAASAARLIEPWLKDFRIREGEANEPVDIALAHQCLLRARSHTAFGAAPNILGEAMADLSRAVELDPTRTEARVALGFALVQAGLTRDGLDHLLRARCLLRNEPAAKGDDAAARRDHLLARANYYLALGFRDAGLWDLGLAATEAAAAFGNTPELDVLRGLCLAGTGRASEAITYAVRMEPLSFRHRSALSSGRYARPSDYANRWIKSQALLAVGDLDGALHVLGELKLQRARRLPFYHRFWQDAGLICELLRDPEALTHYNMIAWRAVLGWAYPVDGKLLAPLVLGYPDPQLPVFISPDDSFRGGSPFGYLAWQLDLMAAAPGSGQASAAAERGLEMCATLLRRHVDPDLVRAFRARIQLAAGDEVAGHADLVFAHEGFAGRGLVDAGTSSLLAHQELLAGQNERSRELYAEALAAMPDDPVAWRELGVALDRAGDPEGARHAMDRALALEPSSLAGWFNSGILAYRHHDYAQALASLEQAWALAPGDQRVQQMLQTVATAQRMAARGQ